MSKIKLTLPLGEVAITGKQVSFKAPCDCSSAEAIQIDGVNYTVCDALGRCVTGARGVWETGEIISVILDIENAKAYIQNSATLTRDEQLSATTAALYGLSADAVPDNVLTAVKNLLDSKATTQTITVDVPVSWTEDTTNGCYYQTVAVSGILVTDNPLVDVILGVNAETNRPLKEAWGLVDRIVTADGSITLYATERVPAVAFTIQLKVVR